MNTLRPDKAKSPNHTVTRVVDLTIAYPMGEPYTLFDLMAFGKQRGSVHFHYRSFDVGQIPSDPEGLQKWLHQLYYDKEQILEEYYKTGRFPLGWTRPSAARDQRGKNGHLVDNLLQERSAGKGVGTPYPHLLVLSQILNMVLIYVMAEVIISLSQS